MDLPKVGAFLRELRNAKKLTQEQLAEILMFPEEPFPDGKPESVRRIMICW